MDALLSEICGQHCLNHLALIILITGNNGRTFQYYNVLGDSKDGQSGTDEIKNSNSGRRNVCARRAAMPKNRDIRRISIILIWWHQLTHTLQLLREPLECASMWTVIPLSFLQICPFRRTQVHNCILLDAEIMTGRRNTLATSRLYLLCAASGVSNVKPKGDSLAVQHPDLFFAKSYLLFCFIKAL